MATKTWESARKSTLIAAIIAVIVLASPVAWGQSDAAAITGTVTDESGAVLSGATVTVANLDTGLTRTVNSGATGNYNFQQLPVGAYEVSAENAGFKREVRRGISLVIGQEAVINLTMRLGSVDQEVVVTDLPPLVNTTPNSTSGLISERQIKELPLNGRSFDQLIALNAGTINNASNASNNLWSSFSVSGQRPESNRYVMNGVDYVGSNASGAFIAPLGASGQLLGVDSVREFNVLLHSYGVEYGKRVGAQVSIVSSSGTNQLHGSVFEYLRNSYFDARNYFDRTNGTPPFERNQFGGSLGGPIKKNRAFIFGNYEGFRQRLATSSVAVVPDAQARQGLLPCYIVKPTSGCPNQSTYVPVTKLATGMLPYAQQFFPAPNGAELLSSGLPTGTAFAIDNPGSRIQEDYGLARFDMTISSKDSFSVNAIADVGNGIQPTADSVFNRITTQNVYLANLQETHIFSSSLLNVATFGVSRAVSSQLQAPGTLLPESLDFLTGVRTGGQLSITGLVAAPGNKINLNTRNYFTESDDVHFSKGKHLLTFGAWLQQIQVIPNGSNKSTAGNVQYPTLLAFLQDLPTQFSANANPQVDYYRQKEAAFYAQDEIKLTPRLTARLGLRMERTDGWHEIYGHASNYVYDANGIPLTDPVVGESALQSNHANHLWQPRVGIAWDPTGKGKWVIRAAFGMYNDLQDNIGRQLNVNAPFNAIFIINNTPLLSIIPVKTGTQGAPSCSAQSTLTPPKCTIFTMGGVDPNMRTPTLQQWSFTVERELRPDLMLQVGYVGSEAYHVLSNIDANMAHPQVCSNTAGCLSGGNLAASRAVTVPQGTLYMPSTPGALPNPFVGPGQTWFYVGTSSYQGGNVSLTKRAAQGLVFKINYTYSKTLDINSAGSSNLITNEPITILNPFKLGAQKGPASFSVKNVFNANYMYELPFGKGRRFVNGGGVLERLIGGWLWSGSFVAESGFPFTPQVGANISGTGDSQNPDVPNWNPNFSGPVIVGKASQWYNPNAFSLPLAGTFGNVGRGSLVGPRLTTFATSLVKNIRVTEKLNLQFRAEAFNLSNHTNLSSPTTTTFTGNTISAAAGTITATATTSRQLQFALKLRF